MPPDLGKSCPSSSPALPSVEPDNFIPTPAAGLFARWVRSPRPAASGPSHPIPTDHHDQIPAASRPRLFSLAPSRLTALRSWHCSDMHYFRCRQVTRPSSVSQDAFPARWWLASGPGTCRRRQAAAATLSGVQPGGSPERSIDRVGPALTCAFLSPLPGNETTAQPDSSAADPGSFMAWAGELAYLAASFTGKATGLHMEFMMPSRRCHLGASLTPIPQQLQPPRSYLSRPNDSYQLTIANTLIAIRHTSHTTPRS